ncbi:MAG: hypothetical protein QOF29_1075 [bacterium]
MRDRVRRPLELELAPRNTSWDGAVVRSQIALGAYLDHVEQLWSPRLAACSVHNFGPRREHTSGTHGGENSLESAVDIVFAGLFEWSQPGSNRRPPACKAGALPAELWPRARPSVAAVAGRKCGARLRPRRRAPAGLGASRSPTQGAVQPGFFPVFGMGWANFSGVQTDVDDGAARGYSASVPSKTTTASPATRTRSPASQRRRLGRPIATPWSMCRRSAPVRAWR